MLDRRSLLTGLAAFGALAPRTALASEDVGTVAQATGQVTGRLKGARRDLASGAPLYAGERLVTGAASRLEAALGPATKLFMGANTRVQIDRYMIARGGEIRLIEGALALDREEPGQTQDTIITSPYALLAVRGTKLFAGPSNGVFGVFVFSGRVDVENRAGRVSLTGGQGTNIAAPGAAPSPAGEWKQPRIDAAWRSVT
jgi:ferric-dicitrate binding protein FerR (iron transport regulator)